MGKIEIKCLKCEKVVRSTHRHRHRRCSCGNVFVEGGNYFLHFIIPKDKKTYVFIQDGKEIKPEDMIVKNKQILQQKANSL